MRKMKDSGIEWIGQIPEDKNIIRNKYLLKYIKGTIPSGTNTNQVGIPYIGASDLENIYGDANYSTYTTDYSVPQCEKKDILILWDGARAGLIGKNHEGAISSTIVKIASCPTISSQFLYWYLKGFEKYLYDCVNGTTIPHMNKTYIENLQMITWSKEEQSRIADFLDDKCGKIDRYIEKQRQIIEKLKAYKQSVITEAVTKGLDPNAPMKDSGVEWIGEIASEVALIPLKYILKNEKAPIKVGPFGSQLSGSDFLNEESDYWVYNQRTVIDNNYCVGDAFISGDKFDAMKGFHVKEGDILITTRGTIGKVSRVPRNHAKGIIHPCIIRFRIEEKKYCYDLLKLIFNSSDFISKQILYKSNATTIDVIYSDTLRNIRLPYWNLIVQKKIAAFLDTKCAKIDKIIHQKSEHIKKIEEYKKSLIYEAVTGKLEV